MRILIAEDEPLEAEALRRRVESLGHEVVAAVFDGARAVTEAGALHPDLVHQHSIRSSALQKSPRHRYGGAGHPPPWGHQSNMQLSERWI